MTSQTFHVFLAACSISGGALLLSCGAAQGDPGPGGGDGGDASAGHGGTAPMGPSTVCTRYLGCIAATAPTALEQISAQYGPDGDCWSQPDLAAACTLGCEGGLADQAAAFPDKVQCDRCAVDADCATAQGPSLRCHGGSCVACLTNADCPAGQACSEDGTCRDGLGCLMDTVSHAICPSPASGCEEVCSSLYEEVFGPGGACANTDPCGHGASAGPPCGSNDIEPLFECVVSACCPPGN